MSPSCPGVCLCPRMIWAARDASGHCRRGCPWQRPLAQSSCLEDDHHTAYCTTNMIIRGHLISYQNNYKCVSIVFSPPPENVVCYTRKRHRCQYCLSLYELPQVVLLAGREISANHGSGWTLCYCIVLHCINTAVHNTQLLTSYRCQDR